MIFLSSRIFCLSTKNPRVGYCFRYGKTYFLSNDYSNNIETKNRVKEEKKNTQDSFDFSSKIDDFLEDF